MPDRYELTSEFLEAIIAKEVSLSGSDFGDANLLLLIEPTRDDDLANRDWARMLLSR